MQATSKFGQPFTHFGVKILALAACSLGLSTAALANTPETLAALAEKAEANGAAITWYESSPEDLIDKVLAAFNEDFPNVKVEYVRLVGGNELASSVIQEEQAAGKSADVLTGGPDHLWQLHSRGLTADLDQEELNLADELLPTSYAVPTAASVYVQIWNTRKVDEDEVAADWDDLLDEKWKDRIGHWVRAASFSQLASLWGEDVAEEKLHEFTKLNPYLFKSTFPLAQGVASGEVDLAIGFYHSLQPVLNAGAPIDFNLLDPTPMHTISSSITKSSVNPDAAKLFVTWLTTEKGAKAYEEATGRGNPVVPGTQTYQMLSEVDVAEWPFDQNEKLAEINDKFNAILATDSRIK